MKLNLEVMFTEFRMAEFSHSVHVYQDLRDIDRWMLGKQKRDGKNLKRAILRISNRAKKRVVLDMDNMHPYYVELMSFFKSKLEYARMIARSCEEDRPKLIKKYFERYSLD